MILLMPRLLQKTLAYFLLALMILYVAGCTYFRVKQGTTDDLVSFIEIDKVYKYFVLHEGNNVYHLSKAQIKDDNILTGRIDTTGTKTIFYSELRKRKVKQYEKSIKHANIFAQCKFRYKDVITGYNQVYLTAMKYSLTAIIAV